MDKRLQIGVLILLSVIVIGGALALLRQQAMPISSPPSIASSVTFTPDTTILAETIQALPPIERLALTPGALSATLTAVPTPTFNGLPTAGLTRLVIQHPTPVPFSWYELTATVKATTTEVKVGEIFTVTMIVTNTGKVCAHKVLCKLQGWANDTTTPNEYLDSPFIEPPYPETIVFAPNMSYCPGNIITCTYTLTATQPGEIVLEGGLLGEVFFSTYGTDIMKYFPLSVRIESAHP